MAVIGTTYRDSVVTRRRLNPHVVEAGLAHDPTVGHAVQGHAARDAEILGAGGFAQPSCPLEQHALGVVLDAPGHVLPMLHRRTGFPVLPSVDQIRLPEVV